MGQTVTDFSELIDLLRGMRGQTVEASVFLPWDDGQYAIAGFSGSLRQVEPNHRSQDARWVLSWGDGDGMALQLPEIVIWERRFIRGELEFTGDADEGLAGIDERRGQNIFLKIYSEGWIVDLTSYV
jgi:hypothetical protein